jgi:hypothetical protein
MEVVFINALFKGLKIQCQLAVLYKFALLNAVANCDAHYPLQFIVMTGCGLNGQGKVPVTGRNCFLLYFEPVSGIQSYSYLVDI